MTEPKPPKSPPAYRIETYTGSGYIGSATPPPARRSRLALLYCVEDGKMDVVMPFYGEQLVDAVGQANAFVAAEKVRHQESEARIARATEKAGATRRRNKEAIDE